MCIARSCELPCCCKFSIGDYRISACLAPSMSPGAEVSETSKRTWSYVTRGINLPRCPALNSTKPYRDIVFRVRERLDFFRPARSASSVSESGNAGHQSLITAASAYGLPQATSLDPFHQLRSPGLYAGGPLPLYACPGPFFECFAVST